MTSRLSSLLSIDELAEGLTPSAHSRMSLERSPSGLHQGFRFEVISAPAELADHAADWDDLAADAIEANVFHERWMLLPAMRAYGRQADLMMVLAYAERPGRPPLLCGLFPLERVQRYKGLPFPHLKLWRHKHCYLGTPLLRRNEARNCLAALMEWLSRDARGAPLIEWDLVASDGLFYATLTEVLATARLPRFVSMAVTRAVIRPRSDAASFLSMSMPQKSLRELGRVERRLQERGLLAYESLNDPGQAEQWISEFMTLEALGWKGRRGSALGSSPENRAFFLDAAREAAKLDRLIMMRMSLDGRAIAMKCNLRAADGCFAFKIAYDESYAKFSPGLLLELEHVRMIHARPELKWVDWCSEPDHFMANRLSLDRRALATLVTATGRSPGKWLVTLLPALRGCVRLLRAALTRSRAVQAGEPLKASPAVQGKHAVDREEELKSTARRQPTRKSITDSVERPLRRNSMNATRAAM